MRRWGRRFVFLLLLLALFVPRSDYLRLTPAEFIALDHLFYLLEWEARNLPRKWVHLLGNFASRSTPSREERIEILDEYLQTVRRAEKEERRVEGAAQMRSFRGSGAAAKSESVSREYLDELLERKRELQPEAEETAEAEIAAALDSIGLQSRFGIVWPPVDVRFGEPPTLLVLSTRDEINMVGGVFLDPEIEPLERDEVERRIYEELGYAAYVDDIAGLATYPNMVSDTGAMRSIIRTAAHEWLHSYWFFHPFGRAYFSSPEMTSLNETAATLAGNEIGDIAFERMGGDLSENARRYAEGYRIDPNFTAFMRETRLEADRLLAEGRTDEAEEYMRERQWGLRLRGYYIRKLNQAYFAFRGRYADSPASVSPVGEQMREYRSYMSDIGEFVRSISKVSTPEEFEARLEHLRDASGG